MGNLSNLASHSTRAGCSAYPVQFLMSAFNWPSVHFPSEIQGLSGTESNHLCSLVDNEADQFLSHGRRPRLQWRDDEVHVTGDSANAGLLCVALTRPDRARQLADPVLFGAMPSRPEV